jgi:hypothetical protein
VSLGSPISAMRKSYLTPNDVRLPINFRSISPFPNAIQEDHSYVPPNTNTTSTPVSDEAMPEEQKSEHGFQPINIMLQDISSLRNAISLATPIPQYKQIEGVVKESKNPSKKRKIFKRKRIIKEESEDYCDKDTSEVNNALRCMFCKRCFSTGQALGGHMSRKHPGKSTGYSIKKELRKKREVERIKLLIAKIKYYNSLGYDYNDLMKTAEGKLRAKSLMCRSKIKKIKSCLTKQEIDDFIDSYEN